MSSKGAVLQVYWPDDTKVLILRSDQWARVLTGEDCGFHGFGYWYEGESFDDYWRFNSPKKRDLTVMYGGDGAVGYEGPIADALLEEFDFSEALFEALIKKYHE